MQILQFFGLISLVAGLLAAPAAWACSCNVAEPDSLVVNSSILFEGAMLNTRYLNSSDCDDGFCTHQAESIFRVDEAFKGELGKTVALRYVPQDGVNCGPVFRMQETLIIAAFLGADGLYHVSSMCTQGSGTFGHNRTSVFEALARFRQRLDVYQAAIDAAPGDPGPVIDKARFLAETRNLPEALTLLSEVLAADPGNREAVLLTAKLRSQSRQDELALVALDPYLAQNATDAYALRARAASLIRLGRINEIDPSWRDFTNLSGAKLDLSGRALDGASFREATLTTVSFAGTSLKQSDFSEARLWNAVLDGADLARADLTHALVSGSLDGVNFENATLDRSAFSFKGRIASLKGAALNNTQFRSPGLGAMLKNYRSERMRVGSLEKVNAAGAIAQSARFITLKITGADFSDADLRQAKFSFSDLSGVSFRGANLEGASFCESDLTGGNLENANLRKVSFVSTKLDEVRLEGAVFDRWTAWPVGFDPIKAGARMDGDPSKERINRAASPSPTAKWPCA
jgi:uncharacterized protein YjbI with pentapeptide repeats